VPVGLTAPPAVLSQLDRLNGPHAVPVAVAVSGGGDSTALLLMVKGWADNRGRRLVALTVDHGLNPASHDWAGRVGALAARIGVAHRVLRWDGPKPDRGLPAAARTARHTLLAQAARSAGAHVILMGHTRDDLAETALMRASGSSTPSPRAWAPSPAWPEGRGVFLLRPLLWVSRIDLRALLQSAGEGWIDDPANDDPRSARARARTSASGATTCARPASETHVWKGLVELEVGTGGDLVVRRCDLAENSDAARILTILSLAAAGGARPARSEAAERVVRRLRTPESFVAGLSGARIEAGPSVVRFCREAGERARSGARVDDIPPGVSTFDGRFEIRAVAAGWRAAWLAGRARRLSTVEQARLRSLPRAVRGALPAAIAPDGAVHCPALTPEGQVAATPLTFERACAALGAIRDEASLCAWRNISGAPKLSGRAFEADRNEPP
jgi:tRNA(Ile)-lysidine synthase